MAYSAESMYGMTVEEAQEVSQQQIQSYDDRTQEKLQEMINQKEDFFNALDLQCADKVELINNLYDEVSDLGWKLDSMKLKYDE